MMLLTRYTICVKIQTRKCVPKVHVLNLFDVRVGPKRRVSCNYRRIEGAAKMGEAQCGRAGAATAEW